MPEADPVEALYAAPPEEFVATRDRLASELRAAGDRAGAARVRALRRPTRAAWALNVAAREQPDAAGALADAVEQLHDAQRELLEGGDAAGMRTAEAAVRDAGDALLAALPVDDPPTVEKARATLRAAAVDTDVLADLVAGRLTHEQVASGFGGFGDLSALAPPVSAPRRRRADGTAGRKARASKTSGSPAGDGAAQREAAEQALRDAAAASETAERERRDAEEAAEREAAEQARREREAAEQEQREREAAERLARIEAARAEEDAAASAATAAGRAVEEAEAALAARRAERDRAQARLADARAAREQAEAE